MKKSKILIVVLAIAVIAAFTGCGNDTESGTDDSGNYSGAFSSFSVKDIYGSEVDQDSVRDSEYTLVYVWGTYCNPCIDSLPDMEKIYKKYKEKGVNVLGTVVDIQNSDGSVDDDQADYARKIAEKQGVTFENIPVPDSAEKVFSDVSVTPTAFFVDRNGDVVSKFYEGAYSYEEWSDIIDKLLES